MIQPIINTPQDSGQGDSLYVATTKINDNFDYILSIVLTTGSTISISQVSGLQTALDDINNELANIPTIQSDINDINTAITSINNTLNSQNISITQLQADIVDLQSQINLKIGEAPIDGLQYARQDGEWTVVSGGTGPQDLQSVLDIGNISENYIQLVNAVSNPLITNTISNTGINLSDSQNINDSKMANVTLSEISIYNTDDSASFLNYTSIDKDGLILSNNGNQFNVRISSRDNDIDSYTLLTPNKSSGEYIIATVDDLITISAQTLQQVTDAGNNTTNLISITSDDNYFVVQNVAGQNSSLINSDGVFVLKSSGLFFSHLDCDKLIFNAGSSVKTFGVGGLANNGSTYNLPDKTTAVYTLATTIDVTDRFTTGGTYTASAGTATFRTNSGATYSVSGFTKPETLQEVTTNGNVTNLGVVFTSSTTSGAYSTATDKGIVIIDSGSTLATNYYNNIINFQSGANIKNIQAGNISNGQAYNFPDKASGTYTIATIEDVTGSTSGFTSQLDLKYNKTGGLISATTVTGSSTTPSAVDIRQTWNTTGVASALYMNITDTASNGASKLIDLNVGGVSMFSVNKLGQGVIPDFSVTNLTTSRAVRAAGAGSSGQNTGAFISDTTVFPRFGLTNNSNIIFSCNNAFTTTNNATFAAFGYQGAINQTGGASGLTRGLYINPTLTSAYDFRGIEVTNGSIILPIATGITTTYAIKTSDYMIDCTSGTFTATLPTAVGVRGKIYIIKNSGAGVVTLATTNSETIDGVTTKTMVLQYSLFQVISDGANWKIISQI